MFAKLLNQDGFLTVTPPPAARPTASRGRAGSVFLQEDSVGQTQWM